jgi:hypothetical protein
VVRGTFFFDVVIDVGYIMIYVEQSIFLAYVPYFEKIKLGL